VLLPHHKARVA